LLFLIKSHRSRINNFFGLNIILWTPKILYKK
jgi:hypothetical protein